MVSNEGRFLLQPCYRPIHHGGFRAYLPEPSFGTVRRSKKGAKHCYYGTWVRRYGNLKIHQLVCEAFHGPKPFEKAVVIHIDEDGLNNRAENLKWGTQKENLNAPKFLEYCKSEERKARLKRKVA
jgi:hypothetical protein